MKAILARHSTMVGVGISALAALAVSLFFAQVSRTAALPLLFAIVQIAIAARFGVKVSVVGSISAAVIFATVLYSPTGSLAVDSATARANLAWMVLASVALSYLLLPEKKNGTKTNPEKRLSDDLPQRSAKTGHES
jgi:K+-sensing histidine kinase KdpD